MQSKLEKLAIESRKKFLIKSFYQRKDNEYNENHPNSNSDGDIKGKGTQKYLDTENGGGLLDIAGNPSFPSSGRIASLAKNFYQTTNVYSINHPNAKSDGDEKGKGTGIKLDTNNGGGSVDINGNPNFPGSGRIPSLLLNFYSPNVVYSLNHPNAKSDGDIKGKGTGVYLDTINGGGSVDINGNPNFPGSGRIPSLLLNFYTPLNRYSNSHPNAKSDGDEKGKGTGSYLDTDNGGSSVDINGNIDFPNSGRVASLLLNFYNPSNNYSTTITPKPSPLIFLGYSYLQSPIAQALKNFDYKFNGGATIY